MSRERQVDSYHCRVVDELLVSGHGQQVVLEDALRLQNTSTGLMNEPRCAQRLHKGWIGLRTRAALHLHLGISPGCTMLEQALKRYKQTSTHTQKKPHGRVVPGVT